MQKVAHLARLAINPEQVADYEAKLSNILDYVEQMRAVDTTGVAPMAHPQDLQQPTRPDQVTEANERDKMQSIAPAVENGLYLVPKVIE